MIITVIASSHFYYCDCIVIVINAI
jgi:hypothetical protein